MSTFIKGEGLILYVWDSSIYRPIACLTSNSLSQTKNIIESQTKCDPSVIIKDSGSTTYEISFEGQYIDTTSVGAEVTKASHDYLLSIFTDTDKKTWKMDTGLADNVAYYGEGIFSDLSLDAAAGDELATFSGTIAGSGVVSTTDPNE
jgi:hypothetical protein